MGKRPIVEAKAHTPTHTATKITSRCVAEGNTEGFLANGLGFRFRFRSPRSLADALRRATPKVSLLMFALDGVALSNHPP